MIQRIVLAASAAVLALAVAGCGSDAGGDKSASAGPVAEPTMGAPADELMKLAQEQFKPIPLNPPKLAGIAATPELVTLGQMLYFDPRLSASHAISCASCHSVGLGGADNRATSVGHHWQLGGRNAPTVFNAAYNVAQFWDGRAKDLFEQAGGPVVNPVEMASPPAHIAEQLKSLPGYKAYFDKAFPGGGDSVTPANVQKAIAAFEATLVTPNAPFDAYLRGDNDAIDAEEKAGFKLFVDKGCAACHGGMNVGGGMYAKFGVVADPDAKYRPAGDLGRIAVTRDEADKYVYKVPTLRNITLTAPYFHTGSAWDLGEAVDVMARAQLGVTLTPDERGKIVAFLGTLNGEQPQVTFPALPPSDGKTTRPEN